MNRNNILLLLVVVACLVALIVFSSRQGPGARRVLRTTTIGVGHYGGGIESPGPGKRDWDQAGNQVWVSWNVGAYLEPEPQPVYIVGYGCPDLK